MVARVPEFDVPPPVAGGVGSTENVPGEGGASAEGGGGNGWSAEKAARTLREEVPAFFESAWRVVNLQQKIWLTQVRQTVTRILMAFAFSAIAFVLFLVAGIFVLAGVYHVLTDFWHIPPAWALLIYAGVFIVVALVLVLVALSSLQKIKGRKKEAAHG